METIVVFTYGIQKWTETCTVALSRRHVVSLKEKGWLGGDDKTAVNCTGVVILSVCFIRHSAGAGGVRG